MNYKNYMKQFDLIFGTNTLKNIKFSNMQVLKKIFSYFIEDLYKPSKEHKRIGKDKIKKMQELKQTFTKEQQVSFEKYCELNNMMETEINEQLFLFGCILGRQLDLETKIDYNNKVIIKKEEIKVDEKQKMLSGELYDANYNENLTKERYKVKDLCYEFNNTKPSDLEKRQKLIKEIFGSSGENIIVEQNFWCDYGYNISVGNNFYMNHNCVILDCNKVEFGDNCFIAPNCGFYTAGHPLDVELRNKGLEYAKSIKIGNNVWIGGNVIVLPGVTIGDNVTIGAGSIVTKDIPSNCLAYGNPCKKVRDL